MSFDLIFFSHGLGIPSGSGSWFNGRGRSESAGFLWPKRTEVYATLIVA